MTKLYFHNALTSNTGTLPSTMQSSIAGGSTGSGVPPAGHADALTVNRSMDTTKGTSQTSKALSIPAAGGGYYWTRFVSAPLGISSLASDTWNYTFAASDSVGISGFFPLNTNGSTTQTWITLYVWRPSTGALIATICDANSNATFGGGANADGTSEAAYTGTFAGSAVSFNTGDILCFEVVFDAGSGITASTGTYYYDGTTETNSNTPTVSSQATHIESPSNTITFNQTFTVGISDSMGTNPSETVKKVGKKNKSDTTQTTSDSLKKKPKLVAGTYSMEDFSTNSTFTWTTDGQTSADGKITNGFLGGGEAGVKLDSGIGKNVWFQFPQTATSSGQTFSVRNDFVKKVPAFTDYRITVGVKTVSQLRTGSPPNDWEVAWLFWGFVDLTHAYYMILKPTLGLESGKVDAPEEGGGQQILYTPGAPPALTIGDWNIWDIYVRNGNNFTFYIDGSLVGSYTDTNQAIDYYANDSTVSMYNEDSSVEYAFLSVQYLNDVSASEGIVKTWDRSISDTISPISSTTARLPIKKHSETQTVSESEKKKAIPKPITDTETISETIKKKIIEPIADSLGAFSMAISKLAKKSHAETISPVSEAEKKKVIVPIAESETVSESERKKAIKPIHDISQSTSETVGKIHRFIRTQLEALKTKIVIGPR